MFNVYFPFIDRSKIRKTIGIKMHAYIPSIKSTLSLYKFVKLNAQVDSIS